MKGFEESYDTLVQRERHAATQTHVIERYVWIRSESKKAARIYVPILVRFDARGEKVPALV